MHYAAIMPKTLTIDLGEVNNITVVTKPKWLYYSFEGDLTQHKILDKADYFVTIDTHKYNAINALKEMWNNGNVSHINATIANYKYKFKSGYIRKMAFSTFGGHAEFELGFEHVEWSKEIL